MTLDAPDALGPSECDRNHPSAAALSRPSRTATQLHSRFHSLAVRWSLTYLKRRPRRHCFVIRRPSFLPLLDHSLFIILSLHPSPHPPQQLLFTALSIVLRSASAELSPVSRSADVDILNSPLRRLLIWSSLSSSTSTIGTLSRLRRPACEW